MDKKEIPPEDEKILKITAILHAEELPDLKKFERLCDENKGDDKLLKKIKWRFRKRKPTPLRIAISIACLFFLVGAGYQFLNANIIDYDKYSKITMYSNYDDVKANFEYIPSILPRNYSILYHNKGSEYSEVTFEDTSNPEKKIIFSESIMKYTYDIDTEDVSVQEVTFRSERETIGAFFVEKDGLKILVWQQYGYFYKLVTTDKEVDLLKIASSLKQTKMEE